MRDKKSTDNRRKLLKSIAAGSGAIVAGKTLPESWVRPVVDSIILPAHAQTSCVVAGCYASPSSAPPNQTIIITVSDAGLVTVSSGGATGTDTISPPNDLAFSVDINNDPAFGPFIVTGTLVCNGTELSGEFGNLGPYTATKNTCP